MTTTSLPTAKSAGYRMPAEWAQHERCWMAWPCRLDFWGDAFPAVERGFARVANAIAEFEPVTMLATPAHADIARQMCSSNVTIVTAPMDDSWTRDMGPNFVVDDTGKLAASVFHFNAWGQKHVPWGKDAAIGHRIAEFLGIPTFSSTIYMEGGGINTDGEGTVLATTQNVLNPNRNPGLQQDDATDVLCEALGTDKVIWLPGDPDDIETDGHIDGIACFIEPGKVLLEVCPATGSERRDNSMKNLEALQGQTDAAGRELTIVTIDEAYEANRTSEIFASSYINFYIANGAIIMPAFGIDRDKEAFHTIAPLFPDREIVQLDISDIAVGGGGIHCITQQQPTSGQSA